MASSSTAEPTEAPTPRRLLEARRQGRVAVSRELSEALGLLGLLAVLAGGAGPALARITGLFRATFSTPMKDLMAGAAGVAALGGRALDVAFALTFLPLSAVLVIGVLATSLQTRGLFAWRVVFSPADARLSPVAGLGRLFSARTLAEIGRGMIRLAVVAAVVALGASALARQLPELCAARPGAVLGVLGIWSEAIGFRVGLALLAMGVVDALLARSRHQRSLMMTRDEARRDRRETEGDPRHKAERRRLYDELGSDELADDQVRSAAVVVVADTDHLAVAVRYHASSGRAPLVVAKGRRLSAERIKQIAHDAGVAIYRDVALAAALNDVPEGEEIPEALYQAVAELLRVFARG